MVSPLLGPLPTRSSQGEDGELDVRHKILLLPVRLATQFEIRDLNLKQIASKKRLVSLRGKWIDFEEFRCVGLL